jgi:uncharacterized protein (DUF2235 family)
MSNNSAEIYLRPCSLPKTWQAGIMQDGVFVIKSSYLEILDTVSVARCLVMKRCLYGCVVKLAFSMSKMLKKSKC